MEDQVITSTTEPTIVESANTSAENTAGLSQVIDQATPMDSNTTYSNLPKVEYQPNMTPTQNLINEAVQTEHTINQETNAGKAMNSFLTQGYDYDKSEAGSYWVAGAINDNNTQMSFLQTLINEEMYDEMDLQKYYYDTNLATARAYAAQKGKEVAYGFYRAAQERALAEGELTGWYMPAEGRYLLGQYTVAQNTLENPDATPEEISKANRVAKAAESWFSANQITTRGIKCLAMMNYEENVRHNTVMGELQKQANDIAMQGANASAYAAELNLRLNTFQLEEYELQSGHNITKELGIDNEDTIGHNLNNYEGYSNLTGYANIAEALDRDTSVYAAVLGATNTEWINNVLTANGKDPEKAYNNYLDQIDTDNLNKSIKDNKADVLDESYLNKQTYVTGPDCEYTKGYDDKHIYEFKDRAYVKDNNGVYHQITEDIELEDGTKLSENIYGFKTDKLTYEGREVQIGSIANNTSKEASMSKNENLYKGKTTKQKEKIKEYEAKGYVWQGDKRTKAKWDIDAGTVMYNKDENKYISISDITGDVEEWDGDSKDIVEVDQPKWETGKTFYEDGSGKYAYMKNNSVELGTTTIKDKYGNERTTTVYMFVDGEGTPHYYYLGKDGSSAALTNEYTVMSESDALKVNPNASKQAKEIYNYRRGVSVTTTKGGKNSDTIKQETEGKKGPVKPDLQSSSASNSIVGSTSKEGAKYSPEQREAVFRKYNIKNYERQEYIDILDPEELDKKLSERYIGILGQGGVHNGK